MRRRFALLVLVATVVCVMGPVGAQAACDQGAPAEGHEEVIAGGVPVTGTHVYDSPGAPGGTSGYVGVHGSTGYIEAGGDATTGTGSIQGSTADGSVDGKLSRDSSGNPHVCVNDTTIV